MAHKKKVKKGKSSERKTAKKTKSRGPHGTKKPKAKVKPVQRARDSGESKGRAKLPAPSGTGSQGRGVYRYIPEFMRARSERSKAAWRKRWDRGTAPIGPVGQQYIQQMYGPTITASDFGPVGGGGGGGSVGPSISAHAPDRKQGEQRVSPAPVAAPGGYQPHQEDIDDFEDYYDDYDFYDREY